MKSVLVFLASAMRVARMVIAAALSKLHSDDNHHDDDDDHAEGCCGCRAALHYHPPAGPVPPAVIDHAMVVYQLSPILSPLVTGIPMLFFYMFDGDWCVTCLLLPALLIQSIFVTGC